MASDFFNPNTTCIICNQRTGLAKNKTKLGTICLNCMAKLEKHNVNILNIKKYTVDELKELSKIEIPIPKENKTKQKKHFIKIGFRTPSLKKSLKARTTGKIKRKVKSSINPLYGKKGMGFIKNPKKSVRNKIYKKTTFSLWDLFK